MKKSYVYIISNKSRTVLYTGVTNNLSRRMIEHANGKGSKFCKQYRVSELIYYEVFIDILNAIHREKQIKSWRREKKMAMILARNPELTKLDVISK